MSDEFTRLVTDEFCGCVVPIDMQREAFEATYIWEIEEGRPLPPDVGRTVCTDVDTRHASSNHHILALMLASIHAFVPGYVDVEHVSSVAFADGLELFQGKSADAADVLFAFDLRVTGHHIHSVSLIGVFRLRAADVTDRLRMLQMADTIEVCHELVRLQEERAIELERRTNLMAAAVESLLHSYDGLGSIGSDSMALVGRMLMRM